MFKASESGGDEPQYKKGDQFWEKGTDKVWTITQISDNRPRKYVVETDDTGERMQVEETWFSAYVEPFKPKPGLITESDIVKDAEFIADDETRFVVERILFDFGWTEVIIKNLRTATTKKMKPLQVVDYLNRRNSIKFEPFKYSEGRKTKNDGKIVNSFRFFQNNSSGLEPGNYYRI
jgi:hypothetical protein